MSRSFSSALFKMRSNSAGRLGFNVTGEIGAWRRILSKMMALVPLPNQEGDNNNYFNTGTQRLNRNNIDGKNNWNRNAILLRC